MKKITETTQKEDNFWEKIYKQVKKIPKGKVASYGQIAVLVGHPRCARQVGWALHANPSQSTIPCHRVVTKDGKLSKAFAFGGENIQKQLLENEGVKFNSNGLVKEEYFMLK